MDRIPFIGIAGGLYQLKPLIEGYRVLISPYPCLLTTKQVPTPFLSPVPGAIQEESLQNKNAFGHPHPKASYKVTFGNQAVIAFRL